MPITQKNHKRLWLDLGDFGEMINPRGSIYQDHGMGLLRTILHQNSLYTDLASIRTVSTWKQLKKKFICYDMLLMNIRSSTYPNACKAAHIFKEINPNGLVIVGGMHATVALDEIIKIKNFDYICQGPGEEIIVDLVKNPSFFPRVFNGKGSRTMKEWPMIDRALWPKPINNIMRKNFLKSLIFSISDRSIWPLESAQWGKSPAVTILTSRVCPYQCSFCNESSYIKSMGRKPVDMVIDELNFLDRKYGPIGSVVIHDSLFFQNPGWLLEWIDKYPRLANKKWPYWAAARPDLIRKWPDLFTTLVKNTNWMNISLGFESGSNRILQILNKECTEDDNYFAIQLLNNLGDNFLRMGKKPPRVWANIILGIPGENRDDAFKTMKMLQTIRYADTSISYYSPYPGSALGYQLIAEGKSLMTSENYHRYAGEEKVKSVDYSFYRDLLGGKYDHEINKLDLLQLNNSIDKVINEKVNNKITRKNSNTYLFDLKNGKKKLTWGRTPKEALEILRIRLTKKEMEQVMNMKYSCIKRQDIIKYVNMLG